jgi:anti-sigma-K factor RskA
MTMSNDIHTLTGAYVLDAVSDIERRAFEHHMTDCPACTQEVIELRETANRLGGAAAMAAPTTLWQGVRRAINTARQLPPLAGESTPTPTKVRRWPMRAAAAIAAAAAVVAGITWHNQTADLEHRLAQSHGQVDKINSILAAPDAQVAQRSGTDGSTVTVVMSRNANGMILMAQGLPALASTQSFQAWFVTPDGHKTAAGLLNASSGALVMPDLSAAASASFVALTLEPRGGSGTPSSNVVITVPMSA